MVTSWREEGGERDWYETEVAGIRVHWLPVPYSNQMSYRDRIQAFFRFAWKASRKAASLPADVVFATSTPLTIALPGAYAARRQKVPMVFEVRDLWPDVPCGMGVINSRLLCYGGKILESFAYKSSREVVALTPTMRDFLSGKGVALENISIIPNGADIEEFSSGSEKFRKPAQEKEVRLLYCGGLGPAHGPDYLVDLAEQLYLIGSPVVLDVVGDGRSRAELEAQAHEKGVIGKNIRFHGSCAKREVPAWYAESAASIMTMAPFEILYRHSVQNKFFDSLAAGKPIVSNYRGWSSELAEREGAGLIIPMDDVRDAAVSLTNALQDQAWVDSAAESARALAEERFSRDQLAGELERVLVKAAGTG